MSQEKLQPLEKEEDITERLQAIRRKHIGSIPPPAPMEIFDPEVDNTEERPPSPPVQITASTPLNSHRRFLGRPITLGKRAARKPFLWMLEPITRQINPVLNAFQSYFESHEERFVHVNRRMDELEQSRIASEERHRQLDGTLDHQLKKINLLIDGLQEDSRGLVQGLRKEILGELKNWRSETERRLRAMQDASAEGLEKMDQLIEERILRSQKKFSTSLEELETQLQAATEQEHSRAQEARQEMENRQRSRAARLEDHLSKLSTELSQHRDAAQQAGDDRLHRLLMLEKMKIEERLARLERRTTGKMPPAQENRPIAIPEAYRNFDSFLFSTKFRGERETIISRQQDYVEYFQGCQCVLDIGCGRGEFLQLLKEGGIGAEGVDLDADAVAFCGELGLNAHHADAIAHLRSLEAGTLDGIFCAQVVEHMTTGELIEMIDLCFDRLKPGGVFLAETLNSASLSSLEHFYRDPTHVRPVAPETLEFLLSTVGFNELDIHFHPETEDDRRLQEQPIDEGMNPRLQDQIRLQNENIARLNQRLFGPIDYSILGRKQA